MSQKNSPFKFLDSYEKEDVKVFFGRDQETQDLYDALSGVKHLMVYGPSGSGKSSLVECGLRNQFSDADWFALTIRKGRDINASVFIAINEALRDKIELDPKTKLPINPDIGFSEAIEKLFEERYQPVYLLFDQFEELLITGDKQEKIDFFTNLNTLIRNRLPSRVLLIMREEFIGHFSEFEPLCPSIFQHRFRIEKMGRKQVQEVVKAMLEAPQYETYFKVENSDKLAKSILEKLPDKRLEIELSHVQVFLGELWDRALEAKTENELPLFSADHLKKDDNLESVLESFLIKQIKELEKTYGKRVPIELLAVMISERNTKLQLSEANISTELTAKEVKCKRPLSELLKELERRRIIRAIKVGAESQYEISHDTLALVVGENKTEDMKMRERALGIYEVLMQKEGLFSQDDIDYLRPYEQNLAFPESLQHRISKSIAKIKSDKNEKLLSQKKQLKRTRRFALVISIIGICAIIASGFAVIKEQEAKEQTQIAREQTKKSNILALTALSSEQLNKNPTLAIRLAERVWQEFPNSRSELVIQKAVYKAFYEPIEGHNLFYTNHLKGHTGDVNSAVFSPDGKTIVTASFDKTAKLWDAETGEHLADLKEHMGYVYSAVFSPACDDDPIGGETILTASTDNTAKLWNGKTGELIADLVGHKAEVNSAVFSPDGKTIVTASNDNTAKLWSGQTGEHLADLKGHDGDVKSAVFSPDGKTIVTASSDKTAKLWNVVDTSTPLANLKGHKQTIYSAVFSPDGKTIVTVSQDSTAKLWSAKTYKHISDLKGHKAELNSAVFSPDGKTIVTASNDNIAKLWNWETGEHLADLKGHKGNVNKAIFSPDGKTIVTASSDKTAKVWNADTRNPLVNLKKHERSINSAVFSPNGKTFVTTSSDHIAKVWDARTGKHMADLKGHGGAVNSAVFSPDGKSIVTASKDSTAKLWNAADTRKSLADLIGHGGAVNSAVFSPDGKTILTASKDKTVKLWDARTGKHMADLKGHGGAVNSAVFSPDGKTMLTASKDKTVKLWNAADTREPLAELIGHENNVVSALFSPNGKTIVTASWDKTAKLWDAETGKPLANLDGHEGAVKSAVFSPDGKTIVTASGNKTAKLWNGETGKYLADLQDHKRNIYSAVFSPDGKTILTPLSDFTTKLWLTPKGIMDWLGTQNIYKLENEDLLELGIDFIDVEN